MSSDSFWVQRGTGWKQISSWTHFTRLRSGPAIFEAKSVTDDNELAQIRHGLSQLYEYRYRHDLKGATLWLVSVTRTKRELGR